MAATTFHSIIIFWKETAFPRWRAMDRRWKRNSVSLMSSVTTVMRRPISCVTSMAVLCHAPAVSMASGQKMWVLAKLAYLSVLLCAALWAAAPAYWRLLLLLLLYYWLTTTHRVQCLLAHLRLRNSLTYLLTYLHTIVEVLIIQSGEFCTECR